jgi:hypothetical protein
MLSLLPQPALLCEKKMLLLVVCSRNKSRDKISGLRAACARVTPRVCVFTPNAACYVECAHVPLNACCLMCSVPVGSRVTAFYDHRRYYTTVLVHWCCWLSLQCHCFVHSNTSAAAVVSSRTKSLRHAATSAAGTEHACNLSTLAATTAAAIATAVTGTTSNCAVKPALAAAAAVAAAAADAVVMLAAAAAAVRQTAHSVAAEGSFVSS